MPVKNKNLSNKTSKMKILLLLAAVIVAALAVTEEQKNRLKPFVTPCREKTGMSQEDFHNGLFSDIENPDPKIKEIVLCVHKKIGMATENGEINKEKMKERIQKVTGNDDQTEKMMKKCLLKKDTPEETMFHMTKCLHKNMPDWYPVD